MTNLYGYVEPVRDLKEVLKEHEEAGPTKIWLGKLIAYCENI